MEIKVTCVCAGISGTNLQKESDIFNSVDTMPSLIFKFLPHMILMWSEMRGPSIFPVLQTHTWTEFYNL